VIDAARNLEYQISYLEYQFGISVQLSKPAARATVDRSRQREKGPDERCFNGCRNVAVEIPGAQASPVLVAVAPHAACEVVLGAAEFLRARRGSNVAASRSRKRVSKRRNRAKSAFAHANEFGLAERSCENVG